MALKVKLKTKGELDALLMFLDTIERKIFTKEGFNVSTFVEEWGHYPWFDQVQDSLENETSQDYNEKLQAIKELGEWARKLEQVKLILPFQPSQGFIDEVYSGIEPSEPSGLVLDIVVDNNITSGGKLFYRGRYMDLTLKSRIENLFNKEDVVRKYL